MEGAAFMYVCLNEKIDCVQIRSVSNKMIENETFKLEIENSVPKLNTFIIDFINSLK